MLYIQESSQINSLVHHFNWWDPFPTTGSESAFILFARTDSFWPDDLSSLQESREEQTLKSFERDCGTLGLGLKNRALQGRNQEAGELIALVLA